MIRDPYAAEHAYFTALAEDGNGGDDPDLAHERQHEDGDPATVALLDGVAWIDETDDGDAPY